MALKNRPAPQNDCHLGQAINQNNAPTATAVSEETPQATGDRPAVFVGFDSAWKDRAPGGICSVAFDGLCFGEFRAPVLLRFDDALDYIEGVQRPGAATIVALDQPTIVPNQTGMRPVEKVADYLISWMGGRVQAANRDKKMMFCDKAPIWRFLRRLNAQQHPELARTASSGLYLIEVFPALALASLDDQFCGYHKGPRYNPDRPTFRMEYWVAVIAAARAEASRFQCVPLIQWLDEFSQILTPIKADQDRLDAVLCLLVAIRWRLGSRQESVMIGDLRTGYMISPVSVAVMDDHLSKAGKHYNVAVN
jgi:predicted RNase H-like nuclease